jgi:6-phosphogluconate dehydrogenase
MHLIAAADDEHGWGLNYSDLMQLWRGGCIIQSDAIIDLLDGVCKSGEADKQNLLAHPTIAGEVSKVMASFRELVVDSIRLGAYVPALSASLEYLKYSV